MQFTTEHTEVTERKKKWGRKTPNPDRKEGALSDGKKRFTTDTVLSTVEADLC